MIIQMVLNISSTHTMEGQDAPLDLSLQGRMGAISAKQDVPISDSPSPAEDQHCPVLNLCVKRQSDTIKTENTDTTNISVKIEDQNEYYSQASPSHLLSGRLPPGYLHSDHFPRGHLPPGHLLPGYLPYATHYSLTNSPDPIPTVTHRPSTDEFLASLSSTRSFSGAVIVGSRSDDSEASQNMLLCNKKSPYTEERGIKTSPRRSLNTSLSPMSQKQRSMAAHDPMIMKGTREQEHVHQSRRFNPIRTKTTLPTSFKVYPSQNTMQSSLSPFFELSPQRVGDLTKLEGNSNRNNLCGGRIVGELPGKDLCFCRRSSAEFNNGVEEDLCHICIMAKQKATKTGMEKEKLARP